MSEIKECVSGTEGFSELIANIKFVHCFHGNTIKKVQTSKMVGCFFAVLGIFFEIEVFSSSLKF